MGVSKQGTANSCGTYSGAFLAKGINDKSGDYMRALKVSVILVTIYVLSPESAATAQQQSSLDDLYQKLESLKSQEANQQKVKGQHR
jgi:hypothetical protein